MSDVGLYPWIITTGREYSLMNPLPASDAEARFRAEFQWIPAMLARHVPLQLVMVFGSMARGTASLHSDLDVAVLAEKPLDAATRYAMIADLAEKEGRPVDLIDLHDVGEPLLGEILQNAILLAGTPAKKAALQYRHLVEEADFVPLRNRLLRTRAESWIG